jgi:hypothetical protein
MNPADAGGTYVLRILFGPLCGLELPLDAGRYFFVTANGRDDTHALGESALKNVDQTFWIPGGFAMADDRSPSSSEWQTSIPNFAIEFGEHSRIDIFGPVGLRSQEVDAGCPFESDGIRFMFRRGDEAWPEATAQGAQDGLAHSSLAHSLPAQGEPGGKSATNRPGDPLGVSDHLKAPSASHPGAIPDAGGDTDAPNHHVSFLRDRTSLASHPAGHAPKPASQKWRMVAIVSIIAGFTAAGLHASSLVSPARTNSMTNKLTEQLEGSPNPPVVRYGRDGKVYVLVATSRDAAWVLQALHKAGGNEQVRVRVEAHELERLESILRQRSVRFFTMRFDQPARPTLLLESTDHPEDKRWSDTLREVVLDAIPYADDLAIERHPLASIDEKARSGLDAMQIPYRSVQQDSRTTYQITRALDDAELNALDQFAQRFAHNWGKHQIRFKFQAGDDAPPGKSYRYGRSNYVSAGGDSVRFVKPVL